MRDFPYLESGFRILKQTRGEIPGFKEGAGDGFPKTKPRNYGIAQAFVLGTNTITRGILKPMNN